MKNRIDDYLTIVLKEFTIIEQKLYQYYTPIHSLIFVKIRILQTFVYLIKPNYCKKKFKMHKLGSITYILNYIQTYCCFE